jgi:hypothetical protein
LSKTTKSHFGFLGPFGVNSKMMCKRPNEERRPPSFHEFGSEEVHSKRNPQKKKTLMFEHYNLVDSMERGVAIF